MTKSDSFKNFLKKFEAEILGQAKAIDLVKFEAKAKNKPLKIEIYLLSPSFHNKDGSISKTGGDWDNFPKHIQDACFNLIPSLNDSQIMKGFVYKYKSDREGCIVKITINESYKDEQRDISFDSLFERLVRSN